MKVNVHNENGTYTGEVNKKKQVHGKGVFKTYWFSLEGTFCNGKASGFCKYECALTLLKVT